MRFSSLSNDDSVSIRGDFLCSPEEERTVNMRRGDFISLALFFCVATTACVQSNVTILKDNEYGGVTKVITYSEEDDEYKRGTREKISSYNAKGDIVKTEIRATKDLAEREGWEAKITYYWGKSKIDEVYSTESESTVSGFYQVVDTIGKHGKLSKREFYIRPTSVIGTLGVYERVIHYDANGNQTRFEDLDRLGNPVTINLEDYRKAEEKVKSGKQ